MRITSKFGFRIHPIDKVKRMHNGLDIVSSDGKVFIVHAVAPGRVIRSRCVDRATDTTNTWQWGNYVAVRGDDGKTIYYCHLASRSVKVGDRVKLGDQIGIEGNTGYSTGVHLHFEVRNASGVPINAADYLGVPNRVGEVDLPILEGKVEEQKKTDTFVIPKGAVYTNGKAVPGWCIGREFTISRRKPGAVLLKEINSWVKV